MCCMGLLLWLLEVADVLHGFISCVYFMKLMLCTCLFLFLTEVPDVLFSHLKYLMCCMRLLLWLLEVAYVLHGLPSY